MTARLKFSLLQRPERLGGYSTMLGARARPPGWLTSSNRGGGSAKGRAIPSSYDDIAG
jgi:hypothetical protein